MKKAVLAACVGLVLAVPAAARDLSGKLGLGFTQAFSPEGSGLTSLSARYWLDKQLGIEGVLGFKLVNDDDGPDERFWNLGGRFLIRIVQEDNLHVYGGAGLAVVHEKSDGESDTGVGADAFAGVEFFFQGLPNLGFSTEVGLQLTDTGETTSFGTRGGSFANFGIRYYY
ncbi:MAG: outer membrane beta-barrel protein [Deltaproteobacteria bacterium]|nr:outer membrane beta-barrel protein [Deltaproteobacteria bacterium]